MTVRVLKHEEPLIEESISAPAKRPAAAPYHSPKKRETATTKGISVIGTACPIARVMRPEYLITKRNIIKIKLIKKARYLPRFFFIIIHPTAERRPDLQTR